LSSITVPVGYYSICALDTREILYLSLRLSHDSIYKPT